MLAHTGAARVIPRAAIAAPAAFLALLAPRLRGREPWAIAGGAALLAVLTIPLCPPGVPVLIAAAFGVVVALWSRTAGPVPDAR